MLYQILALAAADLADLGRNHSIRSNIVLQGFLSQEALLIKLYNCQSNSWVGLNFGHNMKNTKAAIIQIDPINAVKFTPYHLIQQDKVEPASLNWRMLGWQVRAGCSVVKLEMPLGELPLKEQNYRWSVAGSKSRTLEQHTYVSQFQVKLKFGQQIQITAQSQQTPALLHGLLMTFVWLALALLSQFSISHFKFMTKVQYLHGIVSSTVTGLTGLSILYKSNNKGGPQDNSWFWQIHQTCGQVVFYTSVGMVVLGILKLYLVTAEISYQVRILANLLHRVVGHSLTAVAAGQVIASWMFWGNASLAVVSLLLAGGTAAAWVYMYFNQVKRQPESYRLDTSQCVDNDYIIFQDKAYYLGKQFSFKHPGGNSLIHALRGKEVDRFLYGMYPPHEEHEGPAHIHSPLAIRLLNVEPSFSLKQSQYLNSTFYLCQRFQISKNTYLVQFSGQHWSALKSVEELGKYYCIYQQTGTKRLYSQIKSFHPQHFYDIQHLIRDDLRGFAPNLPNPVFVFKVYPKGKFTPRLMTAEKGSSFQLQGPRGLGLSLGKQPGSVAIIAGGTGVFPFIDLFYMLLIKNQELMKFSFVIYVKFAKDQNYFPRLIEAVRDLSNVRLVRGEGMSSEEFREKFCGYIRNVSQLRKVIICGPPKMNKEVSQSLTRSQIGGNKILIL